MDNVFSLWNNIMNLKLKILKTNIKKVITRSISAKIFLITSFVLILFLTVMYATIVFAYEDYYKHKKVNIFIQYINIFGKGFNKLDEYKKSDYIKNFQNDYYVKVVIFDKNMHLSFDGNLKCEPEIDMKKNSHVSNEAKIANSIYIEEELYRLYQQSAIATLDTYLPPYNGRVLYAFMDNASLTNNNTNSNYKYIFILSSMQPIDDAVTGIKDFFVYFYIVGIFIVFIISLIFSRFISKPLKSINNVAVKMSSFDFSEKCSSKYNDEIGSLAKSLNLLSSNLQRSLKRLRENNKKLENDIEKERNLEKIRKEFVEAVSHDLKTPVSIIQGYAEGIKDGIFEQEEEEYYLDVIIDETNKMNCLIKDMLDLSALEGGNIAINKESYNISNQLKKVVTNLSPMAKEKGMKILTAEFQDEYIYADYNRIEQVLNNLITNAIKYGFEDTNIKIYLNEDCNGYLDVKIENQGELISTEDFEKIWTRFYKVDKSRNRNVGGTGLGLSISKNIIQLHNGEIGGYNKASTIVFYFKLKKE